MSEHRTPSPNSSQDFEIRDRQRHSLQPHQHLVAGIRDQRAGHLTIMREREIEADQQRNIRHQRNEPDQLAEQIAMMKLAHAHGADQEAHPDIEQREGEGLGGAAEIAELIALGEKEPVEEHLEHEQDQQDPDLEREIAAGSPARGPLQAMAALKLVALELEVAQMPAQAVQLVTALRGLGAKLAHRGRRRLPDVGEPALEIQPGQPFSVGAHLVEQGRVGRIVFRLDALDDAVLHVVKPVRVGRRLVARAAPGASWREVQINRKLVDVQGREDVERRPVVVRLLLEPVEQTGERGLRSQFHRPTGRVQPNRSPASRAFVAVPGQRCRSADACDAPAIASAPRSDRRQRPATPRGFVQSRPHRRPEKPRTGAGIPVDAAGHGARFCFDSDLFSFQIGPAADRRRCRMRQPCGNHVGPGADRRRCRMRQPCGNHA